MLGTITNPEQGPLPRPDYIAWRAQKHNTTEQLVRDAIHRCEKGDSDFPEDYPEALYEMSYSICEDIAASGGEVDPVIEEQVHQHVHHAPETAPESPEALEVLPPAPNTETLILEAAREAKLESNGYSRLREVFDFSDDMVSVRSKENAIISPQDWGTLLGFAIDLGKKSIYLMGAAVNALDAQGYENVTVQLAGEFGIHYTTLSNAARMCSLVPEEKRVGLYPTVVQEIALRRYDKDEDKNREIVLEMVEQAKAGKWSCEEARSHACAKQGKDSKDKPQEPSKKELQDRVKSLEAILHRILANYAGGSPDMEAAISDAREAFRGNTNVSDPKDSDH